jgi:hypothetical protein
MVKELEGQEMSFMDLDNKMMELGFCTVFGSGAEHDIHDDQNVVYTSTSTSHSDVQIFFKILHDHGEDEDETSFTLKIIKVENF